MESSEWENRNISYLKVSSLPGHHCKFLGVGHRRGRDRMVVWFTTTYAISAYHH